MTTATRSKPGGARPTGARAASGYLPAPKQGRPPLRQTPKGLTYAQGRPHNPTPPPAAAQTQPLPAQQQQPSGSVPAPQPAAAAAATPARTVTVSGGAAQQAGGAILALFLWPLLMNLVRGGTGQMWGWVRAKFINEPYGSTASSGSSPSFSASAVANAALGVYGGQAAAQQAQGNAYSPGGERRMPA